jgi:hypothetical protein
LKDDEMNLMPTTEAGVKIEAENIENPKVVDETN